MRNTLLAIALASAALVALPIASQAADTNGFFVNGNIGQSNLDRGAYNDSDTGYSANFGYRWAVAPSALIGIEGGYTDLGSISPTSAYNGLGIVNARIHGWNVGANAHVNINQNWYVSGRAGYFRPQVTGGYLNPADLPVRVSSDSNKWYAGAGFGYDFNNNLSVGLNYDYYKADTSGLNFNPNLVSVSAEYRC